MQIEVPFAGCILVNIKLILCKGQITIKKLLPSRRVLPVFMHSKESCLVVSDPWQSSLVVSALFCSHKKKKVLLNQLAELKL